MNVQLLVRLSQVLFLTKVECATDKGESSTPCSIYTLSNPSIGQSHPHGMLPLPFPSDSGRLSPFRGGRESQASLEEKLPDSVRAARATKSELPASFGCEQRVGVGERGQEHL